RGILRLVEVLEVNLSRSRLQGSSFRPELVRTPVAEIVRSAGGRAHDLLQNGIEIDITPEAETVRILADADMLGITIINLVENGVKFSAINGRGPVRLSCGIAGDDVIIAVEDQGI